MKEITKVTKLELCEVWGRADAAWHAELVRLFGKRAGDIRYTRQGSGEEGSELRRLYDAFHNARVEWENAK